MATAWVTCQACRTRVLMNKEHWRNNKAYCQKCYDDGKEAAVEKVKAMMDKEMGVKPEKKKKAKTEKKPISEKCETCSGSEEHCIKCGGMLCVQINDEECEQTRYGKLCLTCYDKSMGVKE